MNLPTQLSLLRIGLTIPILFLLFTPSLVAKLAALGCFLLASLTDWLDGFLARRLKQTSAFGALIDPIADKILTLSLFAAFVKLGMVPLWMAVVIAVREITVTGVRLLAAQRRVVLAAAREGKQKMASQVICLLLLLANEWARAMAHPQGLSASLSQLLSLAVAVCLWVTVTLTAVSGIVFFIRHRMVLARLLGG